MTNTLITKPVFISCARRASAAYATALHAALGGDEGRAFLDTSDIETGERFRRTLGEAVLSARVIVVFADEAYFTRWYCLREWHLTLHPYRQLLKQDPAAAGDPASALQHIVVAVAPSGVTPAVMSHLPPPLQTTSWPAADQTEKLAAQVHTHLGLCAEPIRKHLDVPPWVLDWLLAGGGTAASGQSIGDPDVSSGTGSIVGRPFHWPDERPLASA